MRVGQSSHLMDAFRTLPAPAHALPPSSSLLRVCIQLEGQKAIINHTISSGTLFNKTSQKFGQWTDKLTSSTFGLGFGSEPDCTAVRLASLWCGSCRVLPVSTASVCGVGGWVSE